MTNRRSFLIGASAAAATVLAAPAIVRAQSIMRVAMVRQAVIPCPMGAYPTLVDVALRMRSYDDTIREIAEMLSSSNDYLMVSAEL